MSWSNFPTVVMTVLACLALAGCTRPGRERMCENPMELTSPYIAEAELVVTPTLPDEDAEVRVNVTLQAGYNCDPETLVICGARLVEGTSGDALVDLALGFPDDFDGLLDCPEARILDLVDLGTRNGGFTTACLRDVDLVLELCSVECPEHSWTGTGRASLDCS